MASPKKKVDDLIGPQADVGAFVRSAIPTSFLHHALRFEEVDPMGNWLMNSPTLPVDSALAAADWDDSEVVLKFQPRAPSDGKLSWHVDYSRMIDLYAGSPDWDAAEGNAWQSRVYVPIEIREFFASPKQALLSTLSFKMVKKRIARYHLAENVDNQVANAHTWAYRVERIVQGMAGNGWRPAQVGTHPGTDTLFAIGNCLAEGSKGAEDSFQAALESVGLIGEGVRMVRRGGESGPWQVDFNVKEAEEPDFGEISPEEVAIPAIEAHPGIKSVRLLHAIHRAIKKRYPGLMQSTLDVSGLYRDERGWPMYQILLSGYKEWPRWGIDPETGQPPVPVEYSPDDVRRAIEGAVEELHLDVRELKADHPRFPYPTARGLQINLEEQPGMLNYHADFIMAPLEKFDHSPYYRVDEARIRPEEFAGVIRHSIEQTPGFLDRQYLLGVKDAFAKANMDVYRLLMHPTSGEAFAGKMSVYVHFSVPFYKSDTVLHEDISRALEDDNLFHGTIQIFRDPNLPAAYGYMATWSTYTRGKTADARAINIGIAREGIDIEPSAVAAYGMERAGFEDFARFKRLIGIVLAHSPEGILLNFVEDWPSPRMIGSGDSQINLSFKTTGAASPLALHTLVIDAMDKLGMQPIRPANPFQHSRWGLHWADIQVLYKRLSPARRVFGYDGDKPGSLDDKFGMGIIEAQERYGTAWIQKGLKAKDPWWEDRTRVSRASTLLHQAGFAGDVSFFPPMGNYTSFGSLVIHLRPRDKEMHRARVAALVNPILKRCFGFRMMSFQSIIPGYEGTWRQPGPDTRKQDMGVGWFTIKYELESTSHSPDKWGAPNSISLPIGEAEEDDIVIDPGELLHQSDPRIKHRLMALEAAEALKAMGYRGNVSYHTSDSNPLQAYLELRILTGIKWVASDFHKAGNEVMAPMRVPVQQAIYPILLKYGMQVFWKPESPNANDASAYLYGDEIAINMLVRFRIHERPRRYPYFTYATPIAEAQISPEEVMKSYMGKWHYVLTSDRATPGAKYWLFFYQSMTPQNAVARARVHANLFSEKDARDYARFMNWLMEQPGWDYMSGKWSSASLWLKDAREAGLVAVGLGESVVLEDAPEDVDPQDIVQGYANRWHWKVVREPAAIYPHMVIPHYVVYRGLTPKYNTGFYKYEGYSSAPQAQYMTDLFNFAEDNGTIYDPHIWPDIRQWMYRLKETGVSKAFDDSLRQREAQEPSVVMPIQENEDDLGIDPQALYKDTAAASLEATSLEAARVPIRRMAAYLKGLGYEGRIELKPILMTLTGREFLHYFVIHSTRPLQTSVVEEHINQAIAASGYRRPRNVAPPRCLYVGYNPRDGYMFNVYLPIKGRLPGNGYLSTPI